jgi:hypothetical protein
MQMGSADGTSTIPSSHTIIRRNRAHNTTTTFDFYIFFFAGKCKTNPIF